MNRSYWLTALTVLVFGATVTLLLYVMPGPRRSTDYLVIGAVATMVCLLVLFLILIRRANKS
jgi:hypothetical protein